MLAPRRSLAVFMRIKVRKGSTFELPRSSVWPPAAFHFEQLAAFGMFSGDEFEEIAEQALRLINPLDDKKAVCQRSIKVLIAMIKAVHSNKERPAAQIRDDIQKLYAALRKTKAALDELFKSGCGLHLPMKRYRKHKIMESIRTKTHYQSEWLDFYNVVIAKIALLENLHNPIRKGAPVSDPTKVLAAAHSFNLLSEFGRKQPTETIGGPFYELASLLYEGATGVRNANLERYCRKVFKGQEQSKRKRMELSPEQAAEKPAVESQARAKGDLDG
jgi:hypothetical protein